MDKPTMKKLLLALVLCLIPTVGWAQCNGAFPASTACGSVNGGPPGPITFSQITSGSSSSGNLQIGATVVTGGVSGNILGMTGTSPVLTQFYPTGTGSNVFSNSPTINSPTIVGANLTSPTITNPSISGVVSGNNIITSNNLAIGAAASNLLSGTITTSLLAASGAVQGTYTNANIAINNKGIITSANTGSSGGGTGCTPPGPTSSYLYNSNTNGCGASTTLITSANGNDAELGVLQFYNAGQGWTHITSSNGSLSEAVRNLSNGPNAIAFLNVGNGTNFVNIQDQGTNNPSGPGNASGLPSIATGTNSLYIVAGGTASSSGIVVQPTGGVVLTVPATSAQIQSAVPGQALDAGNVFNSAGGFVTIPTTPVIFTPDFSTGFNFQYKALNASPYTIQNPVNAKAGQTGCFLLLQAPTTTVSVSFGNKWYWSAGTSANIALTQTASAQDLFCYVVGPNATSTYLTLTPNMQP